MRVGFNARIRREKRFQYFRRLVEKKKEKLRKPLRGSNLLSARYKQVTELR